MMYDAPIFVWLGECDRHPEKEEECKRELEAHVRLFYKMFSRNKKKNEAENENQIYRTR